MFHFLHVSGTPRGPKNLGDVTPSGPPTVVTDTSLPLYLFIGVPRKVLVVKDREEPGEKDLGRDPENG